MVAYVQLPTLVVVHRHILGLLVLHVGPFFIFEQIKDDCFVAVCSPACANSGACTAPGTCTCTSSWTGATCTTRTSWFPLLEIRMRSYSNMAIFFFQLYAHPDVQIVELVLLQTLVHAQHHGLVPHAQQVCSCVFRFMYDGSRLMMLF